jgi:hypothetical protein
VKARPKDVYAIINQGNPYIATEAGYLPVEKINNDFYFTYPVKVGPGSVAVAMGVMFGLLGSLIASADGGTTKDVEMKIDHLSGRFIQASY